MERGGEGERERESGKGERGRGRGYDPIEALYCAGFFPTSKSYRPSRKRAPPTRAHFRGGAAGFRQCRPSRFLPDFRRFRKSLDSRRIFCRLSAHCFRRIFCRLSPMPALDFFAGFFRRFHRQFVYIYNRLGFLLAAAGSPGYVFVSSYS